MYECSKEISPAPYLRCKSTMSMLDPWPVKLLPVTGHYYGTNTCIRAWTEEKKRDVSCYATLPVLIRVCRERMVDCEP